MSQETLSPQAQAELGRLQVNLGTTEIVLPHRRLLPVRVSTHSRRRLGVHDIEQRDSKPCAPHQHSRGMMPGLRKVLATALSIGRMRVVFGDVRTA